MSSTTRWIRPTGRLPRCIATAGTNSWSTTDTGWASFTTSRRIPGEFDNLWDSSDHVDLKIDLMQRSFDASMLAMDRGPERIGPM